ncbi:MAG: hypothetical protein HUJ68_14050 [Clostridia bacterium]|nr:hypothetical protein [Clostridia bacterium]
MDRKETKELLKSMNECIRWVNKIVVISYDNHKEMYQSSNLDEKKFKFVAVEGNTRLSCLKSGLLSTFDKNIEIPVVIAEREANETITSFMEGILVTQGIANVMVVKEWSEIAKAKHIYDMYQLKLLNTSTRNADTIKKIITSVSEELGMKRDDVRKAIQRYTIYSKIEEDAEHIPDEKWAYLEAFEVNSDTRDFIGLNEDYSWDEDKAEDIIPILPDLIKNAYAHDEKSKTFRDNFRNYIAESNQNNIQRQDIIDSLQGLLDSEDETETIRDLLSGDNLNEDAERSEWSNTIKRIKNQLQSYPVMQDWASEHLQDFKDLSKHIKKLISIIESQNDE